MSPMPPESTSTVHYQVPRAEWLRVWRTRFLRHIRPLRAAALIALSAALILFAVPRLGVYIVVFAVAYIIMMYYIAFRAMQRALDHNSTFTAPKTLTFSDTGLVITAP